MTFWETLVIAIIPAVITAIATYFVTMRQNKSDLKRVETQVKNNLLEYQNKELLAIKRDAIFNSLSLIDTYISWLNIKNGKRVEIPERNSITKLELTDMGRRCFNELCLTCDHKEIIDLYLKIIFDKESNVFESYTKYRNAARKELGLNEIEFNTDWVFISRISTKNMIKHEFNSSRK